jgi:hypothetical protein
MPISSTQIANVIQGQVGMFSAAAQYAQAVSAQYGFQPSSASPIDDPRDSPALQGGMMASGAIRGADYATGALSGAAMFGMAPRMFDPFTGTAHAAMRGYGASGIAGGIGAGAAVGGAYLALGSVFKWGVDQAVFGAQQHAMLNQQIGGMAPGLGSGQVGQMSSMVSQAARSGMGSVNEMTSLMQQGGADGTVNMQSLSQFQSSFQKLLSNVRSVAVALNTSLTEAQQAMQQVRGLGVSQGDAAGFLGSMRGIGQASGLAPHQMMGLAAAGSQLGRMTGIDRASSAMGQMVQGGAVNMAMRGNMIDGVDQEAGSQYQSAAFRFLGSRYGRTPLAAMMGKNGEYDQDAANQIASGSLSRAQIQQMAQHNLAPRGATDRFNARRSELAGRFVSDFGGQAISPMLNMAAEGSGSPETLRAQLTGLSRVDQAGMEQLNRAMPGIRSKMMQEGTASFQRGAGGGLGDALGKNLEMIIGPYREKLERYGAELAQSAQSVIEDVTRKFVSQPPSRADPSTYAQYFRSHVSGGANPVTRAVQAMGGSSPNYFAGAQSGSWLPSGSQVAAHGTGVGFGELPMNGFAPMGHNQYAGAMALGSIPWSGGRNLMGMAGGAVDGAGASMMRAFASESSGFMGLGGVGTVSGAGRGAGLAARGVGMGMRGLGALTGGLALGALAADIGMNELPEAQRMFGYRPITQGAILGQGASALKFANDTGLLAHSMQSRQIGSMVGGMDYEEMQKQGLTAVGGMNGPGQQLFITQEGLQDANRLAEGAGAAMAAFGRYGKVGAIAMARAGLSAGDSRGQSMMLANHLGIPHKEAARLIMAMKTSGLQANWENTDPRDYRKKWLANQRFKPQESYLASAANAVSSAFGFGPARDDAGRDPASRSKRTRNLMLMGMDEKNSDRLGGKTLDAMQQEWAADGISGLDYKTRLADGLAKMAAIDPINGREDYNDMAGNLVKGNVRPVNDRKWDEPTNHKYAHDWSKTAAEVNPVLQAEKQSARQAAWSAATIGGVNVATMDRFVEEYSEGVRLTGPRKGDGRVTAPENLMLDMLADPHVTARGAGMMSARLSRDGTSAGQAGAHAAGEVSRLRADTEKGRSATKVIANLLTSDFGPAAAKMQKHFKSGAHWTAGIEANLVDSARRLLQLGSNGKPVNSEEAEALAREIDQAGIDYAKNHNDTMRLYKVAAKIATLEAQAPSGGGGQPGDFTKQMTEVIRGMGVFATALNRITDNPIVRLLADGKPAAG